MLDAVAPVNELSGDCAWAGDGVEFAHSNHNTVTQDTRKHLLLSMLLRMLAAFRAVKHHPHHKIVAEVFEAVNLSRRREQRVTRSKLQPLPFVNKPAGSRSHHVELVAGMGLLRVRALGRVDLYLQRAVLELQSRGFAVFGRDGLASIAEFDLSGGGELHFSAPFGAEYSSCQSDPEACRREGTGSASAKDRFSISPTAARQILRLRLSMT